MMRRTLSTKQLAFITKLFFHETKRNESLMVAVRQKALYDKVKVRETLIYDCYVSFEWLIKIKFCQKHIHKKRNVVMTY